jgi:hypothetical protein
MSNSIFLNTGLTQIQTAQLLVENLESHIQHLTYNIRRYHIPVSLVLFYTREDISQQINESIRLTDISKSIKIGDSYFNFVFLLFAEKTDSYTFVKHIEKTKLHNINSFFHFEQLEPTVYNCYNFLNSFLFEIEKKETFF